MATVNEKLTNLADKIRVLSGTENAMGLDAMTTHVGNANTEVATQADLISQIQTALQNKASASEPVLQSKTVTPTTSQQYVTPDSNYDGLSKVTVNAMPTATQATPSISVNSSGLITASATQSAGYVTAGTKSATKQLTTQGAKTITPSTSSQTAVASGVYTTGTITVGAIPSTYIQPSGTLEITENGTHDVTDYASVTVDVASGGSGSGSVETCTVTINMKRGDSSNGMPFNSSAVSVNYINADNLLVKDSNIISNGSGSIMGKTYEFTITVTSKCGTPLTFLNGMTMIATCTIDDAFGQLLHLTNIIGYGFTVLTPDVSGNYTIDLTY